MTPLDTMDYSTTTPSSVKTRFLFIWPRMPRILKETSEENGEPIESVFATLIILLAFPFHWPFMNKQFRDALMIMCIRMSQGLPPLK